MHIKRKTKDLRTLWKLSNSQTITIHTNTWKMEYFKMLFEGRWHNQNWQRSHATKEQGSFEKHNQGITKLPPSANVLEETGIERRMPGAILNMLWRRLWTSVSNHLQTEVRSRSSRMWYFHLCLVSVPDWVSCWFWNAIPTWQIR